MNLSPPILISATPMPGHPSGQPTVEYCFEVTVQHLGQSWTARVRVRVNAYGQFPVAEDLHAYPEQARTSVKNAVLAAAGQLPSP